jgi:hypothetical protein
VPRVIDDPDADFGPGLPDVRPVNDGLLWTGGIATAMVATLVTLTGVVVARGILSIPLVLPAATGGWREIGPGTYLVTLAGTLIATALLHGLLLVAPEPFLFFGWTMALMCVVVGLLPLAAHAPVPSEVFSGAVNVAVCVAIWSLLAAVGRVAVIPTG